MHPAASYPVQVTDFHSQTDHLPRIDPPEFSQHSFSFSQVATTPQPKLKVAISPDVQHLAERVVAGFNTTGRFDLPPEDLAPLWPDIASEADDEARKLFRLHQFSSFCGAVFHQRADGKIMFIPKG